MFIGGEPGPGLPSLHSKELSFFGRAAGAFTPPILMMGMHDRPGPPGSGSTRDPNAWHFSPETIDCANLVLDLAERVGKKVTLIDVDHAGADEPLAARWVRPSDVLPILVRPDGARLAGPEYFTPGRVRRFLEGR
jgi:hypothetical protein